MGLTRLQFILGYSIFLFFVMQLSAMAGQTIISGITPPSVPSAPNTPGKTGFWGFWDGLIDVVAYIFGNIGYFFKLMGASTTFGMFGTVILTPFVIGLIWIIIEVIRGTS